MFPSCLTGLCQSAWSRGSEKEGSAMLCSWAPVLLPVQSAAAGPGECDPPPPPPSAPFRGCRAHPVVIHITKAITCHTASQDCQQHSGQLENVHPSSSSTATHPTGFAALGACPGFCSRGGSRTQHARMEEPRSLVEYLGLQLVRQEGVSDTGNAHPVGSGWLHIAPLPSARK